MNPGESGSAGGEAGDDLDQLLAAANQELLAHIETAADPTAALTAIMATTTRAAPAAGRAATSDRVAHRTPAVLAIRIRSGIRRLSRVLDRGTGRALTLDGDLDPSSALARGLGSHIGRALASDLAWALASDLGVAGNLARSLASGLIRGPASDLGDTLDNARVSALHLASDLVRNPDLDAGTARARVSGIKDILAAERDVVRDLDRALGSQQVDASGADLSDITIEDMDALDGVIWTGRTTWPSGITDQVRACSREIRPGVYQVGQGNDPDRSALIPV